MPFDPFHFFFNQPDQGAPDERDQEGPGSPDDEERHEASGSGFIIRKDGYILTNYHVVADASKLAVVLSDGSKYPATVKGKDQSIDIALIKIDAPHDLPVLPLGDSDSLRSGEWVIAIGNPLGYEHSVTVGVVSGKGRPIAGLNPDRGLANYIQTDAAINFGNSGGPLLNASGEVIGINTAITRNYPGYSSGVVQGIGFALPINHAKSVLDQLMTTGKVARGYLSIQIDPVDENKAKWYGLPDRKGAFVQKVNEDGPAARGGLRDGDVIRTVDGKSIENTEALIQLISAHKPGETVMLGVYRCGDTGGGSCDGRDVALKVKLADRSETLRAAASTSGDDDEEQGDEEKPAAVARLGFSVAELNPKTFRIAYENQMDLPKVHPEGVIVTKVSPQSAAYESGLGPGEIITQIGRDKVTSVSDFRRITDKVGKGQVVRVAVTYYVPPSQRGEEPQQESRFIFFQAD